LHDGGEILGRGDVLEGGDRRKPRRDQPVRRRLDRNFREFQCGHAQTMSFVSIGSPRSSKPGSGAENRPPRQASRWRRTSIMPSCVPAVISAIGGWPPNSGPALSLVNHL